MTTALLLGLLVVVSAPPALLAGFLLGVAIGGGAVAVSRRQRTDERTKICVPKANVCIQF